MIEFLMSKNVTYLELFYIFLGVVLSKGIPCFAWPEAQ